MEKLGLINREQDWKTKYLSLTEEGKEFFNDAVSKQEQFQTLQFSNLTYMDIINNFRDYVFNKIRDQYL